MIKDEIQQETFAPMFVLPQQNANISGDILMLHLCIDLEILVAAAAVWLRLSGQNEMPNISQTETCGEQTMKTYRKINIFRIDLSTEDAGR